jgi:hypothetical protein
MKAGHFLISWFTTSFSRRTALHGTSLMQTLKIRMWMLLGTSLAISQVHDVLSTWISTQSSWTFVMSSQHAISWFFSKKLSRFTDPAVYPEFFISSPI